MNKSDLIAHIADHADITKAAATRALESVGPYKPVEKSIEFMDLDLKRRRSKYTTHRLPNFASKTVVFSLTAIIQASYKSHPTNNPF
jgi:hypothetical protein